MTVAVSSERLITAHEQLIVDALVSRARAAMKAIESYDQSAVDRLCRAVAWRAATSRPPFAWRA